jgi:2-phospho-L-lactate guanylyltransferase
MHTLLVPVKDLATAKSRLDLPAELRRDLVTAMAQDVLGACRDTGLPVVVVRDGPDLDSALRVAASGVPGPVAVVMADLPCLTSATLLEILDRAEGHDRWVVADAGGTGTALLGAHPGAHLDPAFGIGSFQRHGAGRTDLSGLAAPGLRHDVDTLADLAAALPLGVGPRTAAVHLRLP